MNCLKKAHRSHLGTCLKPDPLQSEHKEQCIIIIYMRLLVCMSPARHYVFMALKHILCVSARYVIHVKAALTNVCAFLCHMIVSKIPVLKEDSKHIHTYLVQAFTFTIGSYIVQVNYMCMSSTNLRGASFSESAE